jgi:hypothetical protein
MAAATSSANATTASNSITQIVMYDTDVSDASGLVLNCPGLNDSGLRWMVNRE